MGGNPRRTLGAVALGLLLLLVAAPAPGATVDGGSDAVGLTTDAKEFFFAEGTTRDGFREYLTILNPREASVAATITWDTVHEETGGRGHRVDSITLQPGRTTIDVNQTIGRGYDVVAHLQAVNPVMAERPMYFAAPLPGLGEVSGGSVVPGAQPGPTALFAEGTTRPGFQEYLTIANPSDATVTATIAYDITDAASGERGRRLDAVDLPPGRTTIDVNAVIGAPADVSIAVSAPVPVIAERPTYFATSFPSTGPITGGSTAVGMASPGATAVLAEGTTRAGFQEYLTLLNQSPAAVAVRVSYDLVDGITGLRSRDEQAMVLMPGRTTLDVNAAVGPDKDVSIVLNADGPVAVERPMYFRATFPAVGEVSGGTTVPAPSAGATTFLFAEGTTRRGFQEYLTIVNPAAAALTATITWDVVDTVSTSRQRSSTELELAPGRTTIDVNGAVGPEKDVSIRVEAPLPVLAERPIYFHHEFPGADGLRNAVRGFLADPRLAGATAGLSIVVQGYGEVAGQNADREFTPASNQKLFTAAGALEILGLEFRRTTDVWATAAPDAGVVHGDLVLVGSGDPTLDVRGIGSLEHLADMVEAAGVTRVTGALVGDEGRYDNARSAPGWKTTYLTEGFVGPLSALAVNWNLGGEEDGAYLADPVPGNLEHFRIVLAERGVAVDGPNVNGGRQLAAHLGAVESPTMTAYMHDLLGYSDNLTAELLVKEMGVASGSGGTTAAGNGAIAGALQRVGLPTAGAAADGSGLSRANTSSPNTVRALLDGAKARPWFATFNDALALAGRTGTIYARFLGTPAEGNLRAKTGTIDGVRALSGYVTTRGGRAVTFSILVNGETDFRTSAAMDDLMIAIAADRS